MSKLPKIGKRTVKNPEEYKTYQKLREMLSSNRNLTVEYETEVLPYVTEHTYRPDFPIVHRKDGTKLYIEYKGNGRAFDNNVRQKMIAVKEQYPDVEFFLVFHKDGQCGPKRKDGSFMRQSDWARKNGFRFCIGKENIPEDLFQ